jgi:hypothetical protein
MSTTLTIELPVHFHRGGHGGRKQMRSGVEAASLPPGRVPRVSRLMALALRLDELVRTGPIGSYRELALLGQVTRARVSQIVNLLYLAPDIQEALLFLPPTQHGRDPIILADLLPIAAQIDWRKQRRRWRQLLPT